MLLLLRGQDTDFEGLGGASVSVRPLFLFLVLPILEFLVFLLDSLLVLQPGKEKASSITVALLRQSWTFLLQHTKEKGRRP